MTPVGNRKLSQNTVFGVAGVLLAVFVAAAPDAFAQGTNGTIRGAVTDETGSALPGVTIVTTSPALLVPQLLIISDNDGNYLIRELPVGSYRVTYELPGFQRFVREAIEITARFTATINVTLAVGALQETITVTGASPVVDVASTEATESLSQEYLSDVVPVTRNLQDFASVMPGITPGRRPNIGGGEPTGGVFDTSYASDRQQGSYLMDGVEARQGGGGGILAGHGPDLAAMEELTISTVAGSAEQTIPGVFINMIIKSGGNMFSGRSEVQLQDQALQGNNLPDEVRAQGVNIGDATITNREFTGDLGGPIVRDRLWFYGAYRTQRTKKTALGFSFGRGEDGQYGTSDDIPGYQRVLLRNITGKFTYQASQNYKLIAMYTHNRQDFPTGPTTVGRTTPFEATTRMEWQPNQQKVEIQGSPSSRLVFQARLGRNYYLVKYSYKEPGSNNPFCECEVVDGIPTQFDNDLRINSGPTLSLAHRPRERWQPTGSVSWFPETEFAGTHEFKAGFKFFREYHGTGANEGLHGNYRLYFDTVDGVPSQPFEFRSYNYPIRQRNRMNEGGLYIQDAWRPHARLTLNLGLRYDHFYTFVPPQSKAPSQFGEGGDFPRVEANIWKQWAPRLGMAYDVGGDGRTVAKFTYGLYNMTPGDSFAGAYNKNGTIWKQYRWQDLNGNRDYDPGEVDLDVNGPDFVTLSSPRNNFVNPDLQGPTTHELTASVERELGADLGVKFMYILSNEVDLYENVNILRTHSDYTIPLSFTDPGADGRVGTADDGGPLTVWDYPTELRGGQFVGIQRQNRAGGDSRPRTQTFEVSIQKRFTGRWSVLGSASASKLNQPIDGIVENPNEERFNLNDELRWNAKMTGNYELPYEISLNGTFQIYSGLGGQRTARFRTPNGNVTLRMEPWGSQRSGVRPILNLRVAKNVGMDRGRLRLGLDVLNVLNNASPWGTNWLSGPTFADTRILDLPRIARVVLLYSF